MGDNVDSDLLYDDFQDNDRKEFDNVIIWFLVFMDCCWDFETFYVNPNAMK